MIANEMPVISRRSALARLGAGAIGVGALALMGKRAAASFADAAGANPTDLAVLNFALNLEYLEATYYSYATTGQDIPAADVAGSGIAGAVTVKSGAQVSFSTPEIQQLAQEIAKDELAHVNFLRTAITSAGGTPVSRPAIDLMNSFNTAASAAGLGSSFDPFASETNFLVGAYIFEDVGVTAYHGAAPLITNKDFLGAAAGILGTEAYHAAGVRLLVYQAGSAAQTDASAISTLRATLSAAADDQGVTANGSLNLVPADGNGIVFSRTTRQVLNIVYGAPNASKGLFFPNGLNGAITS